MIKKHVCINIEWVFYRTKYCSLPTETIIFFTAYFIGNEKNLYVDGKIKDVIPVEKPPM